MDTYTFVVENFIIHETRSNHNDTLQLSYSAFVNDDAVANRVVSLGDFDNGEYSTVDYVPSDQSPGLARVVINDPSAKVAFIFQLVNAGNVPSGALSGRLAATADQLAGITAGLAGAGTSDVSGAGVLMSDAFPAGMLLEAFANLWSWLEVDCDGPVAVDQVSGPRYVLDAWTDNPTRSIRVTRNYPGADSSTGCGGNSNYDVIWTLQHERGWMPVADETAGQLISETGLNAAAHNGGLHTFGVVAGGMITHGRTFTGATWNVDALGPFNLADVPVSAISFDDRLHVFGIQTGGSVSSLAYTVDGGSWTPHSSGPASLETAEPVAISVFRHRLYLVARDSATKQLHLTSTSDILSWNLWTDVPSPGLDPASPVSAATLGGRLFVFGVFKTGKTPTLVVMRNSTADGVTWGGWDQVEAGARPENADPSDEPLDVAAAVFRNRVYLATRWHSNNSNLFDSYYVAVNFSEDGDDWSGWREYSDSTTFQPNVTSGVAAVGNHLYVVTRMVNPDDGTAQVRAY